MKTDFRFSNGHFEFEIKSHGGLYYLYMNKSNNYIARADDSKVLHAYIDGYEKAFETYYKNDLKRN